MVHEACTLALLAALCAPSQAAEVPRGSELLRIDDVPGKLGSVSFRHGEHNRRYRRADGTPIRCRDCHHTLAGDEPAAATPKADLRCTYPCLGEVDATRLFQGFTPGVRRTVKIPLQCFAAAGADFSLVNTPFLVNTDQPFQLSFANVRWSPGAAADADATPCTALVP